MKQHIKIKHPESAREEFDAIKKAKKQKKVEMFLGSACQSENPDDSTLWAQLSKRKSSKASRKPSKEESLGIECFLNAQEGNLENERRSKETEREAVGNGEDIFQAKATLSLTRIEEEPLENLKEQNESKNKQKEALVEYGIKEDSFEERVETDKIQIICSEANERTPNLEVFAFNLRQVLQNVPQFSDVSESVAKFENFLGETQSLRNRESETTGSLDSEFSRASCKAQINTSSNF